ncbi:hypothetical protein AUH73_01885 [archaeon 13_1_40CM_4_53_4]|nr:MAG: hypothetical protein AUH73_01885 [archaeon 13_1_40CM_4_53_4]
MTLQFGSSGIRGKYADSITPETGFESCPRRWVRDWLWGKIQDIPDRSCEPPSYPQPSKQAPKSSTMV